MSGFRVQGLEFRLPNLQRIGGGGGALPASPGAASNHRHHDVQQVGLPDRGLVRLLKPSNFCASSWKAKTQDSVQPAGLATCNVSNRKALQQAADSKIGHVSDKTSEHGRLLNHHTDDSLRCPGMLGASWRILWAKIEDATRSSEQSRPPSASSSPNKSRAHPPLRMCELISSQSAKAPQLLARQDELRRCGASLFRQPCSGRYPETWQRNRCKGKLRRQYACYALVSCLSWLFSADRRVLRVRNCDGFR